MFSFHSQKCRWRPRRSRRWRCSTVKFSILALFLQYLILQYIFLAHALRINHYRLHLHIERALQIIFFWILNVVLVIVSVGKSLIVVKILFIVTFVCFLHAFLHLWKLWGRPVKKLREEFKDNGLRNYIPDFQFVQFISKSQNQRLTGMSNYQFSLLSFYFETGTWVMFL